VIAAGATGGDETRSTVIDANAGGGTLPDSKETAPRKAQPLSVLIDRQALDDQLVANVLEGLVVEPKFLAQTPIADPLLQAEQACDEGEGLRECSGIHPLISH
jgi:hypothetical protein